MPQSYRRIGPDAARRIRLVVADVDGTLTTLDNSISDAAVAAIQGLEGAGVMVGLASGRAMSRLQSLAERAGISGPVIAENGGIARLTMDGQLVDLGYSRQPAREAFRKLQSLYPGAIEETADDQFRLVDFGIRSRGVGPEELRGHLDGVQLLDSGYMLHLLQEGVSKGRTLTRLLEKLGGGAVSPDDVMVFGDSTTDLSMFELFPHSVLIHNPRLSAEQRERMKGAAEYLSEMPMGDGFAEVARHIVAQRRA